MDNQHFTNLYVTDLGEDMTPGKVSKLSKKLIQNSTNPVLFFAKDGKTMYLPETTIWMAKRKRRKNITLIKIYKASL